MAGVDGATLTVAENYTATAREWKYSTTSGTGYQSFSTAETGTTYTPNFPNNGTYYIVAESELNGLTTVSNEVQVSVNSITLTTTSLTPATLLYDLSASSGNVAIDVAYTTSGDFNTGNEFTAQLSDGNGSFANPLNIGTITDITSGTISASIPNTLPTGFQYRIRVIASDPAIFGNDNGEDISFDQFSVSVAPSATQNILVDVSGNFLTVTESQNTTAREWRYSATSGTGYQSFSPAETSPSYTPLFDTQGDYYVICASTNQFSDEVISNEVLISVTISVGIDNNTKNIVRVWNTGTGITADLTNAQLNNASLTIMNLEGKEIVHTAVQSGVVNTVPAELAKGIYLVKIYDSNNMFTTKVAKQ